MSTFTTRVELHSATYHDYETLHAEMAKRGFSRQIKSDSGTTYQLPTAEYNISVSIDRAQILERAMQSVRATGKSGEALVTESAGRSWDGLAVVR